MSVQAEYGRALEALLLCVRRIETNVATDWASGLEKARVGQHADLSTAATACMRVLDAIDVERGLSSQPGIGPHADSLREPFAHLYAHCRSVLGIPDSIAE